MDFSNSTRNKISVEQLFRVEGMVAVITGGGTGIGLMMARALAENGAAKVFVVGRRRAKLEEAARGYPNIIPLPGDVTSQLSLKHMAEIVNKQAGYVNLLIANAGGTGPTLEALKAQTTLADFVAHAWSTPMKAFDGVYGLNCTAVYYTILAFLPLLDQGNKQKNYGVKSQVIATASTAAFLRNPRAGFAYTSSKAAVISMMKSFSSYCVPWGIRFNALAPGLFPSDLAESLYAPYRLSKDKPITEEGAFSKAYQPAERAGGSEDMAGAILFLASRAGAFTNGSVMLLDGGKLATMPCTY